jgi:hydroxysqualene dehydroxylase
LTTKQVAIIGAGYAGCAAAVRLVQSDPSQKVTLFEAGPVTGGRARRVIARNEQVELTLDNGLHILIGAYHQTLSMMRTVGVKDSDALLRLPLQLLIAGQMQMRAPASLRNSLGLGWALLTADGLSFSERWAMVRLLARIRLGLAKAVGTVADFLTTESQPPRLSQLLWEPLCVATLNTIARDADATVFVRVLRDALLGSRNEFGAASDLLLPKADLSAMFPEPACEWLTRQGHKVMRSTRVSSISVDASRTPLYELAYGEQKHGFDHIVIATGPREAANLLRASPFNSAAQPLLAQLDALTYRSIHSVYLQYGDEIKLPAPMIGLSSPPHVYSQWVFDRGLLTGQRGMIGVVISDSQNAKPMSHEALSEAVHRELRDAFGEQLFARRPVWSKVIQEKFATFACLPNLQRPAMKTPFEGVLLAGDYVDGPYPATIEGAVRCGIAAASQMIETKRTT